MKKQEIKNLLIKYFKEKNVYNTVNQTELDIVADELSRMNFINKEFLLKFISRITYMIKESVDYSDTNYLLEQMVTLINTKQND